MKVSLYTISKTLYDDQAIRVTLPTENGQISILENHEPLTTLASRGVIEVETIKGALLTFPINNAIVQILPGNHTIINADMHIQ